MVISVYIVGWDVVVVCSGCGRMISPHLLGAFG